ncbi:MAG: hypothetical protein Q8L79_08485 [Methylobacter sp.]|uniref:hypothetical protein n=1 Tax=Methylobacter sp. TaxID=2051955 RepID=UPI00272F4DD6|nr:hypothetical protein [Methylobacter sp.]MDP1665153.1 hypothetical protein [Methylobacter sp.]
MWFFNGNRPAVEFDIDIDAFGGGWSGGSLWGVINNGFKIIGINSSWEMDGYDPARWVFAGGTERVNLIKHGLANFH